MTERPILFSAPMVRAILEGRKSQTRRILKPQPFDDGYFEGAVYLDRVWVDGDARFSATAVGGDVRECIVRTRFAVGDRLWVREACRAEEMPDGIDGVRYAADGAWQVIENTPEASDAWAKLYHYRGRGKGGIGNPVPSIHMPRWASRITLEVTAVKVERLQDISETDATAEGCRHHHDPAGDGQNVIEQFSYLWQSIHGPGSWEANPWVVALTFRRVPQ
jgi:hypothetical protein